jgi:selenocysteine lyase/cysteine desulfurase
MAGRPRRQRQLIVKERNIDSTWPLLAPFESPPLQIDKFDHWNLGTYNSAIQAGIAPAIQLHKEIGVQAIHARLQELTRYWVNLARDIPGFTLHTPLETADLGAISLFSIDHMDSRLLERELRQKHQVHVKYRQVEHLEGLRVSPHLYMLKADLDTFVTALKEVVERR